MTETLPAIKTLESVGVDYLTATARRTSGNHPFAELGFDLVAQSASIGNDVANWSGNGYHGKRAGGVAQGIRYDTHIIRLSSDDAREHWREVYKLSSNVSRIDLQLTIRLERAYEAYIREQHARAMKAKQGRGRRREIQLLWNSVKGDTITFGNRASDVFGRVYDKGREQKTDAFGELIRQEIEYKSKTAIAVAEQLYRSESEHTSIAGIVSSYISQFDVQTTGNGEPHEQCARGRTTNNDVRRRWLHTAVSPSITRLREAGMLQEALDALGLSEYVTINTEKED